MEKLTYLLYMLFLTLVFASVSEAVKNKTVSKGRDKGKRLFSLFNVVTFSNDACPGASSTGGMDNIGTCLSTSECQGMGGTSDGSCASGFGVCCVFTATGCTQRVSKNCTYVQNTGYPSPFTTTGTTCTVTFTRGSTNLCQLRLDFESFTTLLATATCDDTFTVRAPFSSNAASFPPPVCGMLSGQHMYFETGSTGDPQFMLTTSATAGSRTWRIKATYIECSNINKAPVNCAQWHFHPSGAGSITSYNHAGGQMLETLNYQICIRQEEGFCGIQYTESTTTPPDAFQVGPTGTTAAESTACPAASVSFNGVGIICGGALNTVDADTQPGAVTTSTVPFTTTVFANTINMPGAAGFNLEYRQLACAG